MVSTSVSLASVGAPGCLCMAITWAGQVDGTELRLAPVGSGTHQGQQVGVGAAPQPCTPRPQVVQSSGRLVQPLWCVAWVDISSLLSTECELPLYFICLFPPLVIWLFHFNLIRTPCQEKKMQGVLTAVLWELVTWCPLSLMGIWCQGHLSWCPQSIQLKICGF